MPGGDKVIIFGIIKNVRRTLAEFRREKCWLKMFNFRDVWDAQISNSISDLTNVFEVKNHFFDDDSNAQIYCSNGMFLPGLDLQVDLDWKNVQISWMHFKKNVFTNVFTADVDCDDFYTWDLRLTLSWTSRWRGSWRWFAVVVAEW